MREAGIGHWAYPNTGATNESGWTALPGGTRLADGRFEGLGFYVPGGILLNLCLPDQVVMLK